MGPGRQTPYRNARFVIAMALLIAMAAVAGCTPGSAPDANPSEPPAAEVPTTSGDTPATGATPPADNLPEGATSTIADVLASPVEGAQVVLGGTITEMMTVQDFTLDDGSGKVFVDGDDDFGTLRVGDRVLVTGTVDIEDSPQRIEVQATAIERR